MTAILKSPAAYVQGREVTAELGEHTEPLGDSALFIASETVMNLIEAEAIASLEEAGIDASSVLFNGESSESEIERLAAIVDERGADIIIGAGGGKVIDTARAVRELAGGAMVSMPTVASTDAPASALSVIYSDAGEFQEYWFFEDHPELVLVDSHIVASAPTRFFRSGIGDALATWFEADATVCSGGTNVVGGKPTRAGHNLARLCYDTLCEHAPGALAAVENDAVTESVEAVIEANTLLSGLGFESGGLAAAHSVHNGLTQLAATHNATHGEKVNIGTLTQLVLEGRENEFVEEYIRFSLELGLPVTLDDIGLTEPERSELDTVAVAACAESETIHNLPFDVSPQMVRDAMLAADELGHRMRGQ